MAIPSEHILGLSLNDIFEEDQIINLTIEDLVNKKNSREIFSAYERVYRWAANNQDEVLIKILWSVKETHPHLIFTIDALIQKEEQFEWLLSRENEALHRRKFSQRNTQQEVILHDRNHQDLTLSMLISRLSIAYCGLSIIGSLITFLLVIEFSNLNFINTTTAYIWVFGLMGLACTGLLTIRKLREKINGKTRL